MTESPHIAGFAQKRCSRHPAREAAARCPECHGFFCRECITEHDGRVICANCLARLAAAQTPTASKARAKYLWLAAQCFGGIILTWLYFYSWSRILVSIPTKFHEGSAWSVLSRLE